MSVLSRSALESSPLADLHAIASELGLDGFRRLRKADLVDRIVAHQGGDDEAESVAEETVDEVAAEPEARPRRRRGGRGRGRAADEAEAEVDAEAQAEEEEEAEAQVEAEEIEAEADAEDDLVKVEAEADEEERPARRGRGGRGRNGRDRRDGRDGRDDRSRPVGDPRRRESGIGDEQDPNHDRSHERQDPQEAHHATRLRVVDRATDLPDVPRVAGW